MITLSLPLMVNLYPSSISPLTPPPVEVVNRQHLKRLLAKHRVVPRNRRLLVEATSKCAGLDSGVAQLCAQMNVARMMDNNDLYAPSPPHPCSYLNYLSDVPYFGCASDGTEFEFFQLQGNVFSASEVYDTAKPEELAAVLNMFVYIIQQIVCSFLALVLNEYI